MLCAVMETNNIYMMHLNDLYDDLFEIYLCFLSVKANEKPSNLPLNVPNPLVALATGPKDRVTPQQALAQTMAAMHQKVTLHDELFYNDLGGKTLTSPK
jgi:hypothetical protein